MMKFPFLVVVLLSLAATTASGANIGHSTFDFTAAPDTSHDGSFESGPQSGGWLSVDTIGSEPGPNTSYSGGAGLSGIDPRVEIRQRTTLRNTGPNFDPSFANATNNVHFSTQWRVTNPTGTGELRVDSFFDIDYRIDVLDVSHVRDYASGFDLIVELTDRGAPPGSPTLFATNWLLNGSEFSTINMNFSTQTTDLGSGLFRISGMAMSDPFSLPDGTLLQLDVTAVQKIEVNALDNGASIDFDGLETATVGLLGDGSASAQLVPLPPAAALFAAALVCLFSRNRFAA